MIDSSNGRYTSGVYIGTPEDNNLLFPKQMLIDSAKTNMIEMEGTAIYDLDAANGNDYYQKQAANLQYLQNVNFPANFVIGAHYQGVMIDAELRDTLGQILDASKNTGTSYATFDTLSKYITGVKGAKITASKSGTGVTVTVVTTKQIDNFTIKATNMNSVSAKYDGAAMPSSGIRHDGNVWYITNTVGAGTHTFSITP